MAIGANPTSFARLLKCALLVDELRRQQTEMPCKHCQNGCAAAKLVERTSKQHSPPDSIDRALARLKDEAFITSSPLQDEIGESCGEKRGTWLEFLEFFSRSRL